MVKRTEETPSETGHEQAEVAGQKGATKPKDPLFKEILNMYFVSQTPDVFTVNPGLQVGQTQLEIDVAVRAAEKLSFADIAERLNDTPFDFFAYLNCVEFKSVNDKLTRPGLFLILGRANFAAANYYSELAETNKRAKPGRPPKRSPERPRVVSCIVSATYPQSVQDQLRVPYKPLESYPEGFYFRPSSDELDLPCYLIVCSELPLLPKYYPLLVFAAGNKLEDFIDVVVDQGLEVYVKYLVKLHEETVTEAFEKKRANRMLTKTESRFFQLAVQEFGLEETIRLMTSRVSDEELAKQLGKKRLMRMLQTLKEETDDETSEGGAETKEPTKRKRRAKADPTPPTESK